MSDINARLGVAEAQSALAEIIPDAQQIISLAEAAQSTPSSRTHKA